MAFDFYAHKYEDKLTIHDAFTVMSHLSNYDFLLLQRDVKEIFKGLGAVKNKKDTMYSPNNSIRSGDRTSEMKMTKKPSPEKSLASITRNLKRKNYHTGQKKRKLRVGKLTKSMKATFRNLAQVEQSEYGLSQQMTEYFANKSPTKLSSGDETAKTLNILRKNYHKSTGVKSFIEYAGDMYNRVQKFQNPSRATKEFYL